MADIPRIVQGKHGSLWFVYAKSEYKGEYAVKVRDGSEYDGWMVKQKVGPYDFTIMKEWEGDVIALIDEINS